MPESIARHIGQREQDVLYPEVVDPRIADVEAVARWLDYAFRLPGGFRFGLSGPIGLIPGIGDIVDAIFSVYIIARAVQVGIPRVTIARMLVNIGIEAAGGAIPFLGALFDTAFKANRRNYLLLRSHIYGNGRQTTRDWVFLLIAGALLLAGAALPFLVLAEILKHI
jgi:hypothetical protein